MEHRVTAGVAMRDERWRFGGTPTLCLGQGRSGPVTGKWRGSSHMFCYSRLIPSPKIPGANLCSETPWQKSCHAGVFIQYCRTRAPLEPHLHKRDCLVPKPVDPVSLSAFRNLFGRVVVAKKWCLMLVLSAGLCIMKAYTKPQNHRERAFAVLAVIFIAIGAFVAVTTTVQSVQRYIRGEFDHHDVYCKWIFVNKTMVFPRQFNCGRTQHRLTAAREVVCKDTVSTTNQRKQRSAIMQIRLCQMFFWLRGFWHHLNSVRNGIHVKKRRKFGDCAQRPGHAGAISKQQSLMALLFWVVRSFASKSTVRIQRGQASLAQVIRRHKTPSVVEWILQLRHDTKHAWFSGVGDAM